ncbi:MAG: tetratricopeptide repeat protein [Bacteroidia bacterium]
MKYIFRVSLFFFVASMVFACTSPKEKSLKTIKDLEAGDSAFSDELIQKLKTAYTDFANKYPDDQQSAEFLFKAAQKSIYLDQPKEAVEYLDQLVKNYPASPMVEEAMFLSAYTVENNIQDYPAAKTRYEQFLAKYPKGELADDARFSMEHMGQSADELLEEKE